MYPIAYTGIEDRKFLAREKKMHEFPPPFHWCGFGNGFCDKCVCPQKNNKKKKN